MFTLLLKCLHLLMIFYNSLQYIESTPNCNLKKVGEDAYVCVCGGTECDSVENTDPKEASNGGYSLYLSDNLGEFLVHTYGKFNSMTPYGTVISVNKSVTYQSIIGFGGAFTDAAGINIKSLSPSAQNNLLKSYFSPDGIEYTIGRIPMASCDFSTHPYSYDDHDGDFNLTKFALAPEDLQLKIPFIKAALEMSKRNVSLFGSPWSAPAWMKTNKNMTGKGTLIGQPGEKYFKTWALYFVKFIQEYAKNGIKIWGVTGQNEPSDGGIEHFPFQAMGWTAQTQRDFIAKDLGPLLHQNNLQDVKVMILDDARFLLPYWAEQVFQSEEAEKYVSGIAVHWYEDVVTPTVALTSTHKEFPDKFILATEACAGSMPWNIPKVSLGSWERAEAYAHDIIQDLNSFVSGWTDWNIALSMQGGPNWVKNFVDSPIIVDSTKDEFYKQPMYYALGHFSKFILPGSVRIELTPEQTLPQGVEIVGFLRPDGAIVCVFLNRSEKETLLALRDPKYGFLNVDVIPHSIETVLWWPS